MAKSAPVPTYPNWIVAISYPIWHTVTKIVAWRKYRLTVSGKENVPLTGPVILAANHVSWLDPPLVGAYLSRRVTFMAKRELFEIRGLGPLLLSLGAFPVDREGSAKAAIKYSLQVLKAGGCLGIFPEGGRNVAGDREAQGGAALLASLSGAPVVPACIIGSRRTSPGAPLHAKVVYGAPMRLPSDRKTTREELAAFTGEIMAAIAALRESAA